ncbi:hypothetical protein [Haloprofundus halophilus]|uniref:hypothetical protein n=1 Tax=Haloprofundus halophilus TaxID=2283527 RepID=UPI0013009F74|nr:hypothetical protein [Haloprofundus halophilus]
MDITTEKHYNPGQYRLVAVTPDSDTTSMSLDLTPQLKIVDVRQYLSGRPTPGNRGNVVTTVVNRGTGPTWVFNIVYENAPYDLATTIDASPSLPTANLALPKTEAEVILHPNESQEYMGSVPPFVIPNSKSCDGWSSETVVVVQAARNSNTKQLVRASHSGELLSANFRNSCNEISIEMIGKEADDA